MLAKINDWIDQTLDDYQDEKKNCVEFVGDFSGYYDENFLTSCSYVIVDKLPKPDFPELHEAGLGEFIVMDAVGITYKDTYFVQSPYVADKALHFHELVHVLQWRFLGAEGFMSRYISEIQNVGYQDAPLELMAYDLQAGFEKKQPAINISNYVCQHL